jgi:GH24 family phage-related lysozyme (muramidase)
MTPSQNAERLIKHCEGCGQRTSTGTLRSYPDPGTGGAPWTIGYGSTGPGIGRGTEWTQAQADARFTQDLTEFAAKVQEAVGSSDTTQGQFDALVDFAYNLGVENLSSSTLLRKHKAGDFTGAKAEFAKWNKAAGKVLPGLTKRRAAEAALYGGATDINSIIQQMEGGR